VDGAEDPHIRPPEEPRIIRVARWVRLFFDLVYPIALATTLIVLIPVLALNPELQNPKIMALIGGGLSGLGYLGLRGWTRS
jgi:hypothetical protein